MYWVVPLTEPECYIKRDKGSEAINVLLDSVDQITLDVDRSCLVSYENRGQRRAREKAQKRRSLLPKQMRLQAIQCDVHQTIH